MLRMPCGAKGKAKKTVVKYRQQLFSLDILKTALSRQAAQHNIFCCVSFKQ